MKYNETNEESVKYYEEQGKNRGGARKGAGRPKKDTKAVCVRITEEEKIYLEVIAKRCRLKNISELLSRIANEIELGGRIEDYFK